MRGIFGHGRRDAHQGDVDAVGRGAGHQSEDQALRFAGALVMKFVFLVGQQVQRVERAEVVEIGGAQLVENFSVDGRS